MTKIRSARRALRFSTGSALVTSMCLLLTGCGLGESSEGGELSGGITLANAGNAFYQAEAKGAEAEAKRQSADLDVQFAKNDLPTQSDQIDNFIRKGVDFIVVDAVDSEGIGPAISRAVAASIPVVAIDVTATGADTSIMTDNKKAGRIVCEYLIEQIGDKGTFAIADSIPVSAITDRVKGCEEALAEAPGVEVVTKQRSENSRDGGLSLGTELLTAHPNVNAIFASNDPQAAGVALAAEQKGNADVIIGGVDGSAQVTDTFADDGNLVVTAGQSPAKMGSRGVEVAIGIANGEEVPSKPELIDPELLTEKTIADYETWD